MSERVYATGATLDASTAVVLIPFDDARAAAAAEGLRLAPLEGAPPASHPVLVEFWYVRDGRAELDGSDQHEWSATAASAGAAIASAGVGALLGGSVGAWLGPLGAWWGAGAGWLSGATLGEAQGGVWGRRLSEQVSRALGTYGEVAVTMPGVWLPDGRGPFQRVLGMYTDSPIALWTAQTFGYGFGKRLCGLSVDPFRAWTVAEDGQPRLEARFGEAATAEARAPLGAIQAWRALPLLGAPEAGRFAISVMDRAPARESLVGGIVTIHPGCFAPLPPGRHVPAAILQSPNVAVRLTRASAAISV
jgi:hypothetical protein